MTSTVWEVRTKDWGLGTGGSSILCPGTVRGMLYFTNTNCLNIASICWSNTEKAKKIGTCIVNSSQYHYQRFSPSVHSQRVESLREFHLPLLHQPHLTSEPALVSKELESPTSIKFDEKTSRGNDQTKGWKKGEWRKEIFVCQNSEESEENEIETRKVIEKCHSRILKRERERKKKGRRGGRGRKKYVNVPVNTEL